VWEVTDAVEQHSAKTAGEEALLVRGFRRLVATVFVTLEHQRRMAMDSTSDDRRANGSYRSSRASSAMKRVQ
jgi:hypothetical protein